ncbi:MAG: dTDP-4-dehydrorhamnose 3,5-epimerase [Bacteroidales bacterium]|nr:dTDP-4-dehydrorhamnose 3,5-epimerase [Bacteroidales bacterium]
MEFKKLPLEGIYLISNVAYYDFRGSFFRLFAKEEFTRQNIHFDVAHINISDNKNKFTLRGMHMQKEPFEEDKIVFCNKGSIYDVVVDMRKGSLTYKKWLSIKLNQANKLAIYIPKGFAHGFISLEDNTQVIYLMSEIYNKDFSTGVRWNDPILKIDWPTKKPIISNQDNKWPFLKE